MRDRGTGAVTSRKTVHVTKGKSVGAASSNLGRRGKTIYFLLTYDRSERRLVNMEEYGDNREAAETYVSGSASSPTSLTSRLCCSVPIPSVLSA